MLSFEIFLSLKVKFLIFSDGFSETPSPTSSGASPLSPPGGGGGDVHQKSPPPPPPPQPPSKASTSYQQRFTRVPPPRYRPHQPPSVPKMGGGGPPLGGTSNSGLQQSQPIQQQARTSGGRAVLRHDQRSEKSYSAENIMVAGRQQQQVCPLTTKIKVKQCNLNTYSTFQIGSIHLNSFQFANFQILEDRFSNFPNFRKSVFQFCMKNLF